ncbi:MAG: lytic transglycosylase F [Gammaproteobacteria bacterium]|nr:lytic transglycosylase F [Gammaproteobacteria bacterium]
MHASRFPPRTSRPRLQILLQSLILLISIFAGTTAIAAESALIEHLDASRSTGDLPAMRKRRQIRALVTYSRTDFTIMPDGQPTGLQVELLNQYEKQLNKGIKRVEKKTQIVLIPTTFARLLPDLAEGKGDIAAALLTVTPERQRRFAFASGKAMKVDELVVTHHSVGDIHAIEDLAGREVHVLRNSSYAEHLRALDKRLVAKGLAAIKIREADSELLSEDILEMVNAGVLSITVIDDYKARLWAQVLPDIRVLDHVKVHSGGNLGWAVRKNNPKLLKDLRRFSKKVKKGTLLGNVLFRRHLQDPRRIKNPLADSERSRFQEVVDIFSRYADKYDFDVLALAAQAYQESKLDHTKRSHRGAVGIMQLLPSTAADPNVGVRDISSLENNIHAGVKYLAFLRDRYFSDPQITAKNRLAFSWAAYNAGPANVRKMRKKAGKMGLDPNSWFGNVELAAARTVGREPVQYVRNILKYYIAYALVRDRLLASEAP